MNKRNIAKFFFTKNEIIEHSQSLKNWHIFVRSSEFEMIMNATKSTEFKKALELGAGDGSQSQFIAKYCEELICTELNESGNILIGLFKNRSIPNVKYELCDATDLSRFPDKSFDFIFSSNMLEHIENYNLCLLECKRVLQDDGLMIHVMPSRDWKIWNSILSIFLRRQKPQIHGVSTSNYSEYINFGEDVWIHKIEREGLKIIELIRLPFYHGYGPTALPLILLGNKLSWKSSTAYVIKKTTI